MIPLAVVLSLLTAFIFAYILPQLHMGQQVAAITNLNEHRAYSVAKKGIDIVKLGVKYSQGNTFQELIADEDTDGILNALKDIFGTSATPIHTAYTYWNEDTSAKVTQFVSSCLNIDESEAGLLHEKGTLNIAILVRRGVGTPIEDPPEGPTSNADGKDDEMYFWDGSQWVSINKDPSSVWNDFAHYDGSVWYCDFDLDIAPGGGDAEEKADFAFRYDGNRWYVTIGNNGSFRGKNGANQLWDLEKYSELPDPNPISDPFPGIDNDDDTDIDGDDIIEVFIIVRSTGITVAPGPTYDSGPDSTDLMLVNNANSHLPNPMRQVIEAGFYLYEDSGLKTKQFYFGKAHNLKAGDEP